MSHNLKKDQILKKERKKVKDVLELKSAFIENK